MIGFSKKILGISGPGLGSGPGSGSGRDPGHCLGSDPRPGSASGPGSCPNPGSGPENAPQTCWPYAANSANGLENETLFSTVETIRFQYSNDRKSYELIGINMNL